MAEIKRRASGAPFRPSPRKSLRSRVLCRRRRAPRAVLLCPVLLFTGEATRWMKLSGFREEIPVFVCLPNFRAEFENKLA